MVFSDIESSTRLLQRLGDEYRQALDLQRRILRSAWNAWGGAELATEGDSFFVVFEQAKAAVGAVAQAQRDLTAASWPRGQAVRVRMGLHTGEPVRHDGGYVGIDVHRAARIAAAAHGGQVLLSDSTERLLRVTLADGLATLDLGSHRLKDLAWPERLYQLIVPGLESRFPAIRSLGTATSLPRYGTPLVGRDGELKGLHTILLGLIFSW